MSFEEKLIFAEVNKNLLELAVFVSMLGENPTVLKLAVDNVVNFFFSVLSKRWIWRDN